MEEEGFEVLNDAELAIRGVIIRPKPRGKFPLVVIAGGFFQTANSVPVKEAARLLLEAGFAVVRFDYTSAFGKSEGRAADMTISQQVRDLQEAIEYCKRRAYINDKKVSILGIGLGAMAALILEAFHPSVKALALMNTTRKVDGIAWTTFDDREMSRIRLKRYFHVPLTQGEALINYTFFEDGGKVDMARCARNLKTPTLFMAGAGNVTVHPEQSEWLYERAPAKKEFVLIEGIGAIEGKAGVKQVVDLAIPWFKKHG